MTNATPDEVEALFAQIATEPTVIAALSESASQLEAIQAAKRALSSVPSDTLRVCMERRQAALGGIL